MTDFNPQMEELQRSMARLVQEGTRDLERRKRDLENEIEKLERRKERIQTEMQTSFAGASQDLAIRVQGFKDYLVGSLQDLATAAENLNLVPAERPSPPRDAAESVRPSSSVQVSAAQSSPTLPQFAERSFQDQTKRVRSLLDRYRTQPDYYGPPWQVRRTFEPVHAERVSAWFFTQGGRGAIRSMGSRLQDILVASAVISVLRTLYGDRVRTLVLVDTPERLGEWRRGLQDCLGIARPDFGSDGGVVLFDSPEPLAQRADRLVNQGQLPLIIIDQTDDRVSLAMLQFPLWLAFAPDPSLARSEFF